jgi:hypothetical protein
MPGGSSIQPVAEPRPPLRSQLAVIRALVDQIEHLAHATDADGLGAELADEMSRLGYRLLEVATSLKEIPRADEGR